MTIIVMTGATAGIGAVAAARLTRPGARLIVGARGGRAVPDAETLPLDLASLVSVRGFADAVVATLAGMSIDALVLNAGGQRPHVTTRSVDGFELTFATNHLAHYLLLRLLAPHLAVGARVVITTSGTHDPAENTGMPPPNHADAGRLADPATDPARDANPITAGMRAYSASKLCNLMTARAFAASPAGAGRIVAAYEPGLTPGTGLVRSQMWVVRALVWPLVLPLLLPFRAGMNSLADAGRGLADLASGAATPPPSRVYASLRKGMLTWPDPSELARDETAVARLWADSARLVALPE